jgi:serine/threonine-protein kinase
LLTTSESSLSFGKYRLTRLIARGGMGEVYLARLIGELGFEKRLVIKTILPHLANKPRFVELFAAEAKTAVALSHGNIVPIYELGRAEDTLYIVMGHVDGPSLATILGQCRRRDLAPDVGAALHVCRGVLSGLAYAHMAETGRPAVVHRDITPRNILIDRSGQVRIVDFGIAAPAYAEVEVRGGSTGYAAPEQIRGETVDPRADVFSAACVLYELLTLERAFPREGVWTMPKLDGIPEELVGPLRDALSLDAAKRPADAGAFLQRLGPAFARHAAAWNDPQLAAVLRDLFPDGWEAGTEPATAGTSVRPVEARPSTQTFATRLTVVTRVPAAAAAVPTAARPRRNTALVVAALLGLAVGAWWWLQRDAPQPTTGASSLAAGEPGPTTRDVGPAAPSTEASPIDASDDPTRPRAATEPDASDEGAPHTNPDATPAVDPPASPPSPSPREPVVTTLVVVPRDATVLVDGQEKNPAQLVLPPEGATVVVRRAGYVMRTLRVDADHPLPARIELDAAKPAEDGYLQVFAAGVAWAEVAVDGRKAGSTPTRRLALPAGTHRVTVTCTDACPSRQVMLQRKISIKAGETTVLHAK